MLAVTKQSNTSVSAIGTNGPLLCFTMLDLQNLCRAESLVGASPGASQSCSYLLQNNFVVITLFSGLISYGAWLISCGSFAITHSFQFHCWVTKRNVSARHKIWRNNALHETSAQDLSIQRLAGSRCTPFSIRDPRGMKFTTFSAFQKAACRTTPPARVFCSHAEKHIKIWKCYLCFVYAGAHTNSCTWK